MEDSAVHGEKISRLEAAQRKSRLDLAVKGLKSKVQGKNPAMGSPKKKQDSRIPKRKMGDSLETSSIRNLDEEEEVLEEIVTDGAMKFMLSPLRRIASSPKKRRTINTGPKISDMFPDPASWP